MITSFKQIRETKDPFVITFTRKDNITVVLQQNSPFPISFSKQRITWLDKFIHNILLNEPTPVKVDLIADGYHNIPALVNNELTENNITQAKNTIKKHMLTTPANVPLYESKADAIVALNRLKYNTKQHLNKFIDENDIHESLIMDVFNDLMDQLDIQPLSQTNALLYSIIDLYKRSENN